MSWLETFVRTLVRIAPLAALVLAYLSYAPEYLGLQIALLVFIGILVAIGIAMLYLFKLDLDKEFEEIGEEVEQLHTEMNAGFDGVVDGIDELRTPADGDSPETDGGTWGRSSPMSHENFVDGNQEDNYPMSRGEYVDIEGMEPSGAGALGGLVAGGLLGTPYGPAGVLIGGVLGGLLGNAAEYQNLKDKRQEELQEAAWKVISSQAPQHPRTGEFIRQRDGRDDRGEYWEFVFVDDRNVRHYAKLYLEDGRIVYSGSDQE